MGNDQQQQQANSLAKEREQLYEAYNLLHTLAQDFHKPFDAPAVIVVGHQTSGKSALIEALMGFQFNQVGGGTKTRRPIALRMQYNPNCLAPLCFLTLENGKEEQRSMTEIQAYIEAENKRLERDPTRSFDPREINIRMEYKYCPNMIVIDTPGMIHPPKGKQLSPQQRALQQAAKEAEALVLAKIKCPDYIILCVEDTTDWKHSTTRNVVMQVDPQLTRTVLVTTKLDTKLPQFSEAEDIEDFLIAPTIRAFFSQILGGPFFTTVPSGRVGNSREFDTNEAFVQSLKKCERRDRSFILNKLGALRGKKALPTVGISRLRAFLEARIEDSYRRNVAKIVPILQTELRLTESKLQRVEEELQALSIDRLKESANLYREKFAKELSNVIQGTIRASPEEFGETLEMEVMKGGSFIQQDMQNSDAYQHILSAEVGNHVHKLFGGAQYHRALKEFTIAVRHAKSPSVSENEIANAAGMADTHNGVNFMRAACVIAMEKAQLSFEPMLEALRHRTEHIMKRLYPIIAKLVHMRGNSFSNRESMSSVHSQLSLSFQDLLEKIYYRFVEHQLESTIQKCKDDLYGMTKFVTWDIEDKSGASTLYRLLPTPKKMVEIYQMAVENKKQKYLTPYGEGEEEDDEVYGDHEETHSSSSGPANKVLEEWNRANKHNKPKAIKVTPSGANKKGDNNKKQPSSPATNNNNNQLTVSPVSGEAMEEDAELGDYYRVMQLTEEMLSGSSASRTSALVTSLVQYIISSWRNHFARTTAMKFNCFFLMPFLDEFPVYLRNELDRAYSNGMAEVFDIAESRRSLQMRRTELLAECEANSKLQKRFDTIAAQLSKKIQVNKDQNANDNNNGSDDSDHGSGRGGGADGGSGSSGRGGFFDDEEYDEEQAYIFAPPTENYDDNAFIDPSRVNSSGPSSSSASPSQSSNNIKQTRRRGSNFPTSSDEGMDDIEADIKLRRPAPRLVKRLVRRNSAAKNSQQQPTGSSTTSPASSGKKSSPAASKKTTGTSTRK
eukprot:scaffold1190_cov187-Ochromonas_danica.AAC.31